MRPIERRASPRDNDFPNYRDAFGELASRLGLYCSFCERRIPTNLAVEHIQPKGLPIYAHLIGRWENFLLGCVNCNSTKGDQDVVLRLALLPDRDNTAAAYVYSADGQIAVAESLTASQQQLARFTLRRTGLDRRISQVLDSAGQLVAIDRVAQRMETWGTALESKATLATAPTESVRQLIVKLALASGFFSIWMTVFNDDPTIRRALIEKFPGTAQSCFDTATTGLVTPRSPNGLADGSKV